MNGNGSESESLPGIGIFGTGPLTLALTPLLKDIGYPIVAVWGRTVEEAEDCANKLDVSYSTNRVDDVLLRKDVDLVVILSDFCPANRSQIAVKALGIGKHVTVQSPAGLSQDEALRMLQASQYYPKLISALIAGLRFSPVFRRMKELMVGDAALIDVRLETPPLIAAKGQKYSWMCDGTSGGGVLNTFGSQIVDLLHFLTDGKKAARVHGVTKTFTSKTDDISGIRSVTADDFAVFQMELEGGSCFAHVTINSQAAEFRQEISVCGSHGRLTARNERLFHARKGSLEEEEIIVKGERIEIKSGNPMNSGPYLEGTLNLFRHLASKFRDKTESTTMMSGLTAFNDAQYIQAVTEAVGKSSLERSWIKVTEKCQEDLDLDSVISSF